MPTYDYVCPQCGHEFEVFQSMNDKRLTKCPQKGCKGKIQRKIGTGAGFVFKGSGFYITDYRSEGYKAAAKQDTSPAPASGGNSDSSPAPAAAKESAPATTKPAAKSAKKAKAD